MIVKITYTSAVTSSKGTMLIDSTSKDPTATNCSSYNYSGASSWKTRVITGDAGSAKILAVGCNSLGSSDFPMTVEVRNNTTGKLLYTGSEPTYTGSNCFYKWANLYPHVGGLNGTPTYLETLDKLDQWSSAQYIPDRRNSRNKLNL